jgi:hypothetical protein
VAQTKLPALCLSYLERYKHRLAAMCRISKLGEFWPRAVLVFDVITEEWEHALQKDL